MAARKDYSPEIRGKIEELKRSLFLREGDKAASLYTEILKADTDFILREPVQYDLARLMEKDHHESLAMEAYRRLIEKQPTNKARVPSLKSAAKIAFNLKHYVEVAKYADEFLKSKPSSDEAMQMEELLGKIPGGASSENLSGNSEGISLDNLMDSNPTPTPVPDSKGRMRVSVDEWKIPTERPIPKSEPPLPREPAPAPKLPVEGSGIDLGTDVYKRESNAEAFGDWKPAITPSGVHATPKKEDLLPQTPPPAPRDEQRKSKPDASALDIAGDFGGETAPPPPRPEPLQRDMETVARPAGPPPEAFQPPPDAFAPVSDYSPPQVKKLAVKSVPKSKAAPPTPPPQEKTPFPSSAFDANSPRYRDETPEQRYDRLRENTFSLLLPIGKKIHLDDVAGLISSVAKVDIAEAKRRVLAQKGLLLEGLRMDEMLEMNEEVEGCRQVLMFVSVGPELRIRERHEIMSANLHRRGLKMKTMSAEVKVAWEDMKLLNTASIRGEQQITIYGGEPLKEFRFVEDVVDTEDFLPSGESNFRKGLKEFLELIVERSPHVVLSHTVQNILNGRKSAPQDFSHEQEYDFYAKWLLHAYHGEIVDVAELEEISRVTSNW